jgi:hypothetical protein
MNGCWRDMKSSFPLWFWAATVVLLLAVASCTRQPEVQPVDTSAEQASTNLLLSESPAIPPPVIVGPSNIVPLVNPPVTSAPAPVQRFNFNWAVIESSDYKRYAANLRAIGFPEELVRAIVAADLNKHYESREAPLRLKPVPHDASPVERQRLPTASDQERMVQLRDVQREKQAALKEILGIDVPRELLRTPTSRNYEAYEYALSLLPPEKRDAVQMAQENEWMADDMKKSLDRQAYVEAYRQICEERNTVLRQILTPEEIEGFEMNSTPAATELARRTIGMEPTEAEFQAMARIAWQNWVDTGGVYGIWRAVSVPPEQIAAANERMTAALKDTLGPDRYLDYQLATSEVGQQLRNLAARYDLSRETLAQAFDLESQRDRVLKLPDPAELQSRLAELNQRMEAALGASTWQAWQDGRTRRVNLEP